MELIELANGLTLLLEKKPGSKTVAVNALVRFGSNLESFKDSGIAHFIEHLLFNGPKGVSKKELAARIDGIGGEFNGLTGPDYTMVYVQVLGKHFDVALKTVADLMLRPGFAAKDVDFEKKIVLSEIAQLKDTPEAYLYDLMTDTLFPNHPYGKPVIGKKETVQKFNRQAVVSHFKKYYSPGNTLLAVSGDLSEKQLEKIKKVFGQGKKKKPARKKLSIPKNRHVLKTVEKELAQTHLGFAFKTIDSRSKDVYALHVIGTLLGGGLSSRLVQEIREKRGLAYVVQVGFDPLYDFGLFSVYVGTKLKNKEKVKGIILQEFKKLKTKKVGASELKRAKQYIEGKFLLKSGDTLHANKNSLEIALWQEKDVDSFLKKIFAVTPEAVQKAARKHLESENYCLVSLQPRMK